MEIIERKLKGIYEIQLEPIFDHRGFFMRTYDKHTFEQHRIPTQWLQENHSKSLNKNTIRGLHFLLPPNTDSKLIRCIRGSLLDIFVDLREDSPTKGNWDSIELSEDKYRLLYIPKGFAHGFCTLENNTQVIYKHDTFYQKKYDCGIVWNDADLNIEWPCDNPVISEKDKNLMTYSQFVKQFRGL